MNRNQIEAFTVRWLGAICSGNLAEFEHLTAATSLDTKTGQSVTRAAFQARARAVHQAFEALAGNVEALLVDGDQIAWRWSLHGLQRAPFLGQLTLGKRVTLSGVNFQRLEHGVVTEHFTLLDVLS